LATKLTAFVEMKSALIVAHSFGNEYTYAGNESTCDILEHGRNFRHVSYRSMSLSLIHLPSLVKLSFEHPSSPSPFFGETFRQLTTLAPTRSR
jgi:hypothetical protein